MWPKRKKGKARATKVKLKALQPNNDDSLDDGGSQEVAAQPPAPEPVNPRSKEEELISGVWKSKVLNNYKQNPRDSHNLLARIPSGKASFEAGERQKNEAIKDAMIRIVDRMFDNFQNTAYEFNRVTSGSDLELAWIRPSLTIEDLSSWHETAKGTIEVFAGRISTRYWTLAVRGTVSSIATYILPSDKLLGFSTSPTSFPSYLTIVPESDGLTVGWLIANQRIELDLFPSVYRALLDGLIRFASDEAQPGEAFRLEDIGIVPEAPPAPGMMGYQEKDHFERPELLGQRNGHPSLDGVGDPRISDAKPARADRFIDDISNQVAQAAHSETERFRQSMHAPPFGTTQGGPRSEGSSESGMFQTSDSSSGVYRANQQQQDSGAYRRVDSNPFKPVDQSGVMSAQGGGGQGDSEWKTVSTPRSGATDWQKFMQSTRDSIQQQNQAGRDDDKWNTVPGTQQLARPDIPRGSIDNMMAPPPPQNYPSYGNASDPPELLKPDDINIPPSQISQSGIYGVQQHNSQSGAYAAPQPLPALQTPPSSINQSGAFSTQQPPKPINQSGAFSTQQPPLPPPPPSVNQSGVFSTQVGQSGVFSTQPQMLPPNMMPPGYDNQAPSHPPRPQPPMTPPAPPSMMTPPGMPSFPGMIQPGINQSGVHAQPMMPPSPPMYPPGMQAPSIPPGMVPPGMPPQGMPPHGVPPQGLAPGMPPHMVPNGLPALPNQLDSGAHRQLSPQQQQQFNTGGQPAQAVPPPQFNSVPQGFNSNPFTGAPLQAPHAFQPPEPPPVAFLMPATEDESEEAEGELENEEFEGDHGPADESHEESREVDSEGASDDEVQSFETYDEGANEVQVELENEISDGSDEEAQSETESDDVEGGQAEAIELESDAANDIEVDTASEAEVTDVASFETEEHAEAESLSESEVEASVSESGDWNTVEPAGAGAAHSEQIPETSWQQPTVVTEFSMVTSREEMIDPPMEEFPSFPQESFTELPVISKETVQRFEQANIPAFVFSSEDDFVDAISVVLSTIDAQIELLAQQGTQAFGARDFRRAEAIIKLSERLTSFKTEAQEIMQVLSHDDK